MMKNHLGRFVFVAISVVAVLGCQRQNTGISRGGGGDTTTTVSNYQIRNQVVEASCGQCNFGLEGSGCDLAVRVSDVPYFVDGVAIDDHGDAHAADGFCNAIRHARVSGQIVDGHFSATGFELLPADDSHD